MVILKENKKPVKNEKINSLMKVIENEAAVKVFGVLADIVADNQNMKPFLDAGGKPAVVAAYTVGITKGIESYMSSSLDKVQRDLLIKIHEGLFKANIEAGRLLKTL
jgi:hypothetical protein